MRHLVADPYVLFALAGAVLTVLGWLVRELVLPGLQEALQRFVLANLGDIVSTPIAAAEERLEAKVSALHDESLEQIGDLEQRLTGAERRYDEQLNDMRDALKTAVYMPTKREGEQQAGGAKQ